MALEDLSPGDETRRHGDYVGLPHDQASGGDNDVSEGEAVAVDSNGYIAQADVAGAGEAVGILYTYQYYGENDSIRQDRDATVKTQGTVKAKVDSAVAAGDHLAAPDTSATGAAPAGTLEPDNATRDSNFVALTDAQDPDGDGDYYAEVLVR